MDPLRSSWWALLLGAAVAGPAHAAGACRVDPFDAPSAAEREGVLARPCRGEPWQWRLDAPRARPEEAAPGLLRARVDSALSAPLGAGWIGSLRFSWAGSRHEAAGELRSDRALLAAGGLLRMSADLALQMALGREAADGLRSRATVATLWRPMPSALTYLEWAGSGAGPEGERVGARWWLLPRRLALDVGATHLPEGTWGRERVGLTLAIRP